MNYRKQNSKGEIVQQDSRTNDRSLTPGSAAKHSEQLIAWQEKKNMRLANKRLINGQEDLTFSPKLNQKSIDMVV